MLPELSADSLEGSPTKKLSVGKTYGFARGTSEWMALDSLCLASPSSSMNHKGMHSLEQSPVGLRQSLGICKSNYKVEKILWGEGEVLIRQTEEF